MDPATWVVVEEVKSGERGSRANLTGAQLNVGRSRQRQTSVRGCLLLFCLTEGDPLSSSTTGRC
jgi:hypothetical protein